MFNFFKKQQKTKPVEAKKVNKTPPPFDPPTATLDELYSCSVQKNASEFQIAAISTEGGVVNVATDSLTDLKNLQNNYEMNTASQEVIYSYFAKQGFIGFNNCAILAQDWLINKAVSLPCEDAIAVDYDVNLCENDMTDEDTDVIANLINLSANKKYNINEICKIFAINKRKFGQSLCIPLVEGVDYSVPFNIDSVDSHAYKGMSVIEPMWYSPVLDIEASTDPTSARFYQPTWFRLPNGQMLHHSWAVFNTYGNVSDILKPTYYFGGYPLPQLMYEYVYAAHKTAKEAPMLAQSKRLNYMDGNTNALLGDQCRLLDTLNLLSWTRNNWGWLIKKPDQTIGQIDTSLTDFDAVTMLGYQIVAAISGVQSARLLETSPKGWQSSGSLEDKNYSKTLEAIQRSDYAKILELHYKLLAKSELNIEKKYSIVFAPIDNPTEKEQAEIREINSRTDSAYINAGVVSAEEVRDVLRADEKSGYNALTEEIQGEPVENDDPFGDILGGSSNEQAPFSASDEWNEVEHPRDKYGKFTDGSHTGSKNNSKQSKKKDDTSKTIAGVKKGKPMSFKKANQGRVNPYFTGADDGYSYNCQTCVAVFEARLRGYDIEAAAYDDSNEAMRKLALHPWSAYKTKSGNYPKILTINTTSPKNCEQWLKKNLHRGNRYAFGYGIRGAEHKHIIQVQKGLFGEIQFYDPQNGKLLKANEVLNEVRFTTIKYGKISKTPPLIFRIDNTTLNTELLTEIINYK